MDSQAKLQPMTAVPVVKYYGNSTCSEKKRIISDIKEIPK